MTSALLGMGIGLLLLALFTAVTALLAVTVRDLVHAVLWLGASLMGTAGLFAMQGASFLAAIQLLLYVGGIVMLLVFGVMLTREHSDISAVRDLRDRQRAGAVATILFVALLTAITDTPGLDDAGANAAVPLEDLAASLLGQYGLAFEALSLLLLGAMIGAVVLARRIDFGQPIRKLAPRRRTVGQQAVEGLAATPTASEVQP